MSLPLIVTLESPWAADTVYQQMLHQDYARRALAHSLAQGEAPFAGHLLYTQVLDDSIPHQRQLGLQAHLSFIHSSHRLVVYTDWGISPGMTQAIDLARQLNLPVLYRQIGQSPQAQPKS